MILLLVCPTRMLMANTLRRIIVSFGIASWFFACPTSRAFAEPEATESKIDLRVSPAIDMHFYFKTLARKNDDQVPIEFRQTVSTVREIDKKARGGGLSWGMIDSALYDCQTAKQILEAFSGFPEVYRSRFGPPSDPVPLRAPAVKLAEDYVGLESAFLHDHWPRRKRQIDIRLADVNANFVPKMAPCINYMLQHLGIKDPQATIPVYLVVDMPFPGAHTYRRYGGSALCIVSINRSEFEGSLLYESILHEATHALDIEAGSEDVFDVMRNKLLAAGLTRRNKLFRDVPHTVMFVQAAETIRRIVDPKHEHYGVVSKYYDRISRANASVGGKVHDVWTNYLDGKITRSAAIDELVKWTMEKAD